MAINATIVVDFGELVDSVSKLVAEFDDIKNSDKVTFLSTETAFFSIYKYPSTLSVDKPVPTSGMVSEAGTVSRTKTETLRFVGTQSIILEYPPSGPVTVTRWYGNVGQDFSVSGFTATITSDKPCLCDISYQVSGTLWELYPPSIDLDVTPAWPIVVYITAEIV